MANRAYLYAFDSSGYPHDLPEGFAYYDSRHSVPLGWFFFFQTSDVVMVEDDGWHEVRCVTPKADGLERFKSRRSLIEQYLVDDLLHEWAGRITADLARWPGAFIVMAPHEVVDFEDAKHFKQFRAVLENIKNGDGAAIADSLRNYCDRLSEDPQKRLGEVFGYTYGSM